MQQIDSFGDSINIDELTNLFNQIDNVQCYECILLMLTSYPVETIMIYENSLIEYNIKNWDGIFRSVDFDTTRKEETMRQVCDIVYSAKHKDSKLSSLIKQIINCSIENAKQSVICNFILNVNTNDSDSDKIFVDQKYPIVKYVDENIQSDEIADTIPKQVATESSEDDSSEDDSSNSGTSSSSEENPVEQTLRFFKHVDTDGRSFGTFSGMTPRQAASKAFTKLVIQKKKTGTEIENETPVVMQDDRDRIYGYVASRTKLDPPHELSIIDNTTGDVKKKITYCYRNQIKKIDK